MFSVLVIYFHLWFVLASCRKPSLSFPNVGWMSLGRGGTPAPGGPDALVVLPGVVKLSPAWTRAPAPLLV